MTETTPNDAAAGPDERPPEDPEEGPPTAVDDLERVDPDPAARAAVYTLLARAFSDPTDAFYDALASGALSTQVADLLSRVALEVEAPPLATDDDPDTLAARYNDLFVLGFATVVDRTDGTVDSSGPAVPLYESSYREEVSWNDVNLDLARAYDYFGVSPRTGDRDHHDHLRLQLEFAGYLCRLEAAGTEGVARARLDFLDRHLRVLTEHVAERVAAEPGTDVYGEFAAFLDDFTAADVADLAARFEEASG